VRSVLERLQEEADRLDASGKLTEANKVDKAIRMATAGNCTRAFLSLAKTSRTNKVVASLMGEIRDLATGRSLKRLQQAAIAASLLESAANVPTHERSAKVAKAFKQLSSIVDGLPAAFSTEIKAVLGSIRNDVAGAMSPDAAQRISSAAARVRELLSPSRMLAYRKGLDLPSMDDPKKKAITEAITSMRDANIPDDRIPGLLVSLKIADSPEEVQVVLRGMPRKEPEPAPEKPEAPTTPAAPSPAPTPKMPPPRSVTIEYPNLKAIPDALGLIERALDDYLITIVSMITMDPNEMSTIQDEMKRGLLEFSAERLSQAQQIANKPSRIRIGQEVSDIVNDYFKARPQGIDQRATKGLAKTVGDSVKLEAHIGPGAPKGMLSGLSRKEGTE